MPLFWITIIVHITAGIIILHKSVTEKHESACIILESAIGQVIAPCKTCMHTIHGDNRSFAPVKPTYSPSYGVNCCA